MEATTLAMGNKIKQLLDQRGWSIYELNKRAGLTYNTTHTIVTADRIPPKTTYETLSKIAEALGVTIDDLEDED